MNLRKMLKFCKDEKTIVINHYGDQKFLTNNIVMAEITNKAPTWGVKDCFVSAEIPDEERDDYFTETRKYAALNYKDTAPLEVMDYTVIIGGVELQPLLTDELQVLFIDCNLLSVFKNETKEYRLGNLNGNGSPAIFLACYDRIIGIIVPYGVDLRKVGLFARTLTTGAERSRSAGLYDLGAQLSLLDGEDDI